MLKKIYAFAFLLIMTTNNWLSASYTQDEVKQIALQLKVEEMTPEMEKWGLNQSELEKTIKQIFLQENVSLVEVSQYPTVLVRIKGIEITQQSCTTVIQVLVLEEARLTRNDAHAMALAWSQSSLIVSLKQQILQDLQQSLSSILSQMISDLKKSMQMPERLPEQMQDSMQQPGPSDHSGEKTEDNRTRYKPFVSPSPT